MLNLVKMVDTSKFWNKAGALVITLVTARTQKGIDYDGKPFPEYSKGYADLKSSGFTTKDGKRYKQYKGVALERQTNPPNFRLTGKTMRSTRILAQTPYGVAVGWQGREANIVSANDTRKKARKVGGLSEKDLDVIIENLDSTILGNWNSQPSKLVVRI